MKSRHLFLILAVGLSVLLWGGEVRTAGQPVKDSEALNLTLPQKDFLALEPILVTVRLESQHIHALPAAPGESKSGTLRFEVKPEVKARAKAKPLPLEAQGADLSASARRYDLLEWFDFPAKGGTFTVRAVVEHKGLKLASTPATITISRPEKNDKEFGPVDRLHHIPWSNYTTDA